MYLEIIKNKQTGVIEKFSFGHFLQNLFFFFSNFLQHLDFDGNLSKIVIENQLQ